MPATETLKRYKSYNVKTEAAESHRNFQSLPRFAIPDRSLVGFASFRFTSSITLHRDRLSNLRLDGNGPPDFRFHRNCTLTRKVGQGIPGESEGPVSQRFRKLNAWAFRPASKDLEADANS
jgi:hypothetical protein